MKSDGALGAVVVGTGFGVFTHLRALRGAGFDVRALVGRDPGKTAERAARFDVPRACTSLADALAGGGADVVTVATPPHTHHSIVREALDAGKHVLCEKPFARDLAQARDMLVAAEKAGVVHLLGTEFRFATGQELLRRVVADGAIGEPRHALFQLQIPGLDDPSAQLPGWWEDAKQGGGWVGAYGVHVIDQVRITLGEFTGVSASLQTLAPRPAMTADDTFSIHFRLATGVEGVLLSSVASGGQMLAATKLTGSQGSAWVQGDQVWVADRSGQRKIPVPDDLVSPPPVPLPAELVQTTYDRWHAMGIDLAPFTRLCEVLRDRVQGRPVPDRPPAATFRDGVAAQAVLDAVRQSAAERAWISVEKP